MSTVDVDPEALVATARRLQEAAVLIDEIASRRASLTSLAASVGNGRLNDAVCSFVDRWTYGLGCLRQDAQTIGSLLSQSSAYYTATEGQIADAATRQAEALSSRGKT